DCVTYLRIFGPATVPPLSNHAPVQSRVQDRAVALVSLLSPFGSPWSADTLALATSALNESGGCTITSAGALPPFVIGPRPEITRFPSWPPSPCVGVISSIGGPSGMVSKSWTPVASSGPSFVIVGWKLSNWPGLTLAGFAASVTPTSAL